MSQKPIRPSQTLPLFSDMPDVGPESREQTVRELPVPEHSDIEHDLLGQPLLEPSLSEQKDEYGMSSPVAASVRSGLLDDDMRAAWSLARELRELHAREHRVKNRRGHRSASSRRRHHTGIAICEHLIASLNRQSAQEAERLSA